MRKSPLLILVNPDNGVVLAENPASDVFAQSTCLAVPDTHDELRSVVGSLVQSLPAFSQDLLDLRPLGVACHGDEEGWFAVFRHDRKRVFPQLSLPAGSAFERNRKNDASVFDCGGCLILLHRLPDVAGRRLPAVPSSKG